MNDTVTRTRQVNDATAHAVARFRALILAERAAAQAEANLAEAVADPDVDMAAYMAATGGDA